MMTSAASQYDRNRQRKAIAFLALACFVLIICLAQRASVLREMQLKSADVALSVQTGVDAHLSPCQLSAHSILAAQPVFFENVLFTPGLLLVLSLVMKPLTLPPADDPLPLIECRIYLKNCVFRE
jgi:hypothetical protein